MMLLLTGILRALEPPLRFFLACVMALAAALLGCLQAFPELGYPWPGRLEYGLPGLECLLLGFMLVGGLAASRCLPRPGSVPGALVLLLLGFAGSGAIRGIVPSNGLPRVLALVVFAVLVLRWTAEKDREDLIRESGLLVFVLVLIKFVLLDGLASPDAGGATGFLVRSMTLGTLTQSRIPPGDEYRVFLLLLLFAGAVAVRWESLPDPAMPTHPGGLALPRESEAAPMLSAGEEPEQDPGALLEKPEVVPQLPEKTGSDEPEHPDLKPSREPSGPEEK